MSKLSEQPAFPTPSGYASVTEHHPVHGEFTRTVEVCKTGVTYRQWLAPHAPPMPEWWADLHRKRDRALNPHNESQKPPIRGEVELMASWSVEWADALIAELEKSRPKD